MCRARAKLRGVDAALEVVERGRLTRFSFEDVLDYHGPGSPGGAAHAFKVLELSLIHI